jgi:hypothetical protein
MSCVDSNCKEGFQGDVVSNVIDLLSQLTNEGKFMIHIFNKRWTKMWRLFFEEEVIPNPETQQMFLNYKFKDPSEMRFSGVVLTNSDCAFEWREETICVPQTLVDTNANAAATTLIVEDVTKLMGIGAGSEVLIVKADGRTSRAVVASVNTNTDTITLVAPWLSLAVEAGDTVYRGAYNRSWDCDTVIDNKYTYRGARKYQSYFRKISGSLDFQACDLSVDRYVGNGQSAAEQFIKVKERALFEGLVNEMLQAFFLDRNLPDTGAGSETMGLLPAIQLAQDEGTETLIVDYADCCELVAEATEADKEIATQKLLGAFFDNIMRKYDSGMYDEDEITIIINNEQAKEIIKLTPHIRDYMGVQLFQTADSNEISGLNIPVLTYGGIKIQWMYEKFLDRYKFPFHIILPKSSVGVFQRNFPALYSSQTKIEQTKKMNDFIANGYPIFKVVDRSDYDTNGMGDCFKFKYEAEFATAWAGMDKGAYGVGLNLKTCTSVCDICSEEATPWELF